MREKDTAVVEARINGAQAGAELQRLAREAEKFRDKVVAAAKSGNAEALKLAEKGLKSVEKQMADINYQTARTSVSVKNLNGLSLSNLENAKKRLRREIRGMSTDMDGYGAKVKLLNVMNAKIREQRQLLDGVGASGRGAFGAIGRSINNAIGPLGAYSLSLAGIIMGSKQLKDAALEFEDRVANLSSLTGLQGGDLQSVASGAKDLSVSTMRRDTATGGVDIRVTKSASEIVDVYTKLGSMRPELLKNSAALQANAKDVLILAEAAKMELAPATESLAVIMNQFNAPVSESARYINVLAAGSKEGAADITYLAKAVEKSGTIANMMNVSIEDQIALLESAAPKYKEPELLGNSLDKVFLIMREKGIGFKNGMFDISRALDELQVRYKSGESSADIFGKEHAKLGAILVEQRGEFERYRQAVSNTSVAYEQAAINTDTMKAREAQARNEFKLTAIELGERLAPAYVGVMQAGAGFIRILMNFPKIYRENRELINAFIFALIALNAAKIRAVAASALEYISLQKGIGLRMKNFALAQREVFITELQARTTVKSTIAQRAAAVATAGWKTVMSALGGTFGVVTMAIGALITAVRLYDKYNAESVRLEEEKQKAISNTASATNAIRSANERLGATISNLNRLSSDQITALQQQITASLALSKAKLAEAKSNREVIRAENARLSLWQKIKIGALEGVFGSGTGAREEDALRLKNANEAYDEVSGSIDEMATEVTNLENQLKSLNETLSSEQIADKIGTETMANLEEKLSLYQQALRLASGGSEDEKRIAEKINRVNKMLRDKEKQIQSDFPEAGSGASQKAADESFRELEKLEAKAAEINAEFESRARSRYENELFEAQNRYSTEIAYLKELSLRSDDIGARATEAMKAFQAATYSTVDAVENKWNAMFLAIQKENIEASFAEKDEKDLKREENANDFNEKYGLKSLETQEGEELGILEAEARPAAIEDFEAAAEKIRQKYRTLRQERDMASQKMMVEKFNEGINKQMLITGVFTSFFEAMKNRELAAAGDNEVKKKEIAKKYAIFDMLTSGAEIAANTAAGIMATIGQMGFLPALPLIPVIAATGGAQLAAVLAQKAVVAGYEKGLYPVSSASDGRDYLASYGGTAKTGIVNNPTLFLAGEKMPEMIIDGNTFRNIRMNFPDVMKKIAMARNGAVAAYASGKYPEPVTGSAVAADRNAPVFGGSENEQLTKAVNTLNALLSRGIIARVNYDNFKEVSDNAGSLEKITINNQ